MAALPLGIMPGILGTPAGPLSISYDIGTNATEQDLPWDWNAYRCKNTLAWNFNWATETGLGR
jgi:hypothetical protein